MVAYLYCTKEEECLAKHDFKYNFNTAKTLIDQLINGTIFATFDVNTIEKIDDNNIENYIKQSCLSRSDLVDYLGRVDRKGIYDVKGYAIHIDNLKLLKPLVFLNDFSIQTPPQNIMYVNARNDILISLKPKYCKLILQGQKTIEIRRTVLKELEEIAV